jgi:hypothetical protein
MATADAHHICEKIRELMSTDDFTHSVVRKGISVVICQPPYARLFVP